MLLDVLARIVLIAVGVFMIWRTMLSAIRTFVLPRGVNDALARLLYTMVLRLFRRRAAQETTYEGRDRVMAMFAPTALIVLPIMWFTLMLVGYGLIYWALGEPNLSDALTISGYSLMTLGYRGSGMLGRGVLEFSEALFGLILLGLLISYLPTMYSAFSRRETLVTLLDVRAGSPPSAVEMLSRAHRIRGLDTLEELFQQWEVWFAELQESHTSLAALIFFRSALPRHSWVTAAGAVLDTAALYWSVVDKPRMSQAALCLRAGFLALRHISDFFGMQYAADPQPTDPIAITRDEYDEAVAQLKTAGVPIVRDLDQGWRDFQGWRVNYDAVLIQLAALTEAPYAPWSSDRGLAR